MYLNAAAYLQTLLALVNPQPLTRQKILLQKLINTPIHEVRNLGLKEVTEWIKSMNPLCPVQPMCYKYQQKIIGQYCRWVIRQGFFLYKLNEEKFSRGLLSILAFIHTVRM